MRKQCDAAEENAQTLNTKVAELISQLDICRSQCTQLDQEKDMLQKSLDTVKLEKNALDKNKVELNSTVGFKLFINFVCIIVDISLKFLLQLEALRNNYEKLQKTHNKLQKLCDNLEDEKLYLQTELGRISEDADLK